MRLAFDYIIRQRILRRLESDRRIDLHDLDVKVLRGYVTLRGAVSSYSAHSAVFDNVAKVEGVKAIDNLILIDDALSGDTWQDSAIKENIESVISLISEIDARRILIKIKDGFVSVCGTVDSQLLKNRLGSLIPRISDVRGLSNKLVIVGNQQYDERTAVELGKSLEGFLEVAGSG